MIGFLASIAAGAGVPERFAKVAGIVGLILLIASAFGIWLFFHDRAVVARHEDQQQAKLAPIVRQADGNAADARVSDLKRNQADEDAERAAVAPLPDARLSDRQRARACAILRRQRPDQVPTGC